MSFIEKDSTNLLPVLLRLQRRIEGVKTEAHRLNGGAPLCSKCGSRLRGNGDAILDVQRGGWFDYAVCCHTCGERVDSQIFQNWLRSEVRIKLEMGLRPRKETIVRRCKICKQEKEDAAFSTWGSKVKKVCKDCEALQKSAYSGEKDLAGDFGKMFAAVKQAGEREGAKKLARDVIDFLTKKYVESE